MKFPIDLCKYISWQRIGENVYIFNELEHKVFILEDVSADFWQLIVTKNNMYEVVKEMLDKYNTDEDTIRKDVLLFVEKLSEISVIKGE